MLEIGSAALYFSQTCAYQVALNQAGCKDASDFPKKRYFGKDGELWAEGRAKSSVNKTADNYSPMIRKYVAPREEFQTAKYREYMQALTTAREKNLPTDNLLQVECQLDAILATEVLKDPLKMKYTMASVPAAEALARGRSPSRVQVGMQAYALHQLFEQNGLQHVADGTHSPTRNMETSSDDEKMLLVVSRPKVLTKTSRMKVLMKIMLLVALTKTNRLKVQTKTSPLKALMKQEDEGESSEGSDKDESAEGADKDESAKSADGDTENQEPNKIVPV